ncbi:MAG: flagellar hook-length control protein FliK, partial [Amphritea sp.]|nr:flagellar hook-length control protein FliK [Amphritea sp.]
MLTQITSLLGLQSAVHKNEATGEKPKDESFGDVFSDLSDQAEAELQATQTAEGAADDAVVDGEENVDEVKLASTDGETEEPLRQGVDSAQQAGQESTKGLAASSNPVETKTRIDQQALQQQVLKSGQKTPAPKSETEEVGQKPALDAQASASANVKRAMILLSSSSGARAASVKASVAPKVAEAEKPTETPIAKGEFSDLKLNAATGLQKADRVEASNTKTPEAHSPKIELDPKPEAVSVLVEEPPAALPTEQMAEAISSIEDEEAAQTESVSSNVLTDGAIEATEPISSQTVSAKAETEPPLQGLEPAQVPLDSASDTSEDSLADLGEMLARLDAAPVTSSRQVAEAPAAGMAAAETLAVAASRGGMPDASRPGQSEAEVDAWSGEEFDLRLAKPDGVQVTKPAVVQTQPAAGQANLSAMASDTQAQRANAASEHDGLDSGDDRVEVIVSAASQPGRAEATPQTMAAQAARSDGAAVMRQIAENLQKMSDGRVEIRLSPEELGSVRLQLHQGESGLTVTVQAERPETLDLMRRNIDQL